MIKLMDNLRYFLKEINLLREQFIKQAESQERFNIFTTLLSVDDEVYLHSRFISSLLDPKGTHNLGQLPLKLFLDAIHSNLIFSESVEVVPNNESKCEYKEIDILIRDYNSKSAIIIENKIGARDSNHEDRGQLEGYYQIILSDGFHPDNIEVYYLTTDRHEPSQESVCTNGNTPELAEKVRCIDYSREISFWLTSLTKEAYYKPYLRETISQYLNLIKEMTEDINIEERKELAAMVGKTDDNLYSAKLLIENFPHICWHTMDNFNHEMQEMLRQKKLDCISAPDENMITNIVHGGPKIRKENFFYDILDGNGLIWTLGCDYDDLDGFYLGLQKDENKKLSKEWKEKIREYVQSNDLPDSEGWYFWIYVNDHKGPTIYFWDFTYANTDTFDLISPAKRKCIIESIVNIMDAEMKAFNKASK